MTPPIPLPVRVRYDAHPATATLVDADGEDVLMLPYREVQTVVSLCDAINKEPPKEPPDFTYLRLAVQDYRAVVHMKASRDRMARIVVDAACALFPLEEAAS